jgi:hypothetical protein
MNKNWFENKKLVRLLLIFFYPIGLYGYIKCSQKPKITMIIMSIFVGFGILSLFVPTESNTQQAAASAQTAQSQDKETTTSSTEPSETENIMLTSSETDSTVHEDISKIDVSFESRGIKNSRLNTAVFVQNNSTYIFNGSLYVRIINSLDDDRLGSDYLFVVDLNPGQKTYAIIESSPAASVKAEYQWSSTTFENNTTKMVVSSGDPYKFIIDQTGSGGLITNKVEIYVANDRDYKRMYEFIKTRKINPNTLYHAHFFDDEKYAVLPEGGAQSLYWDDEYMKHMIAVYTKNTKNGYEDWSILK